MEKTIEDAYDFCIAEGKIIAKDEVDINKAISLFESAENEIRIAKKLESISENAESHLFKTYYDALRLFADALLVFDSTECLNHYCLFACIAVKHPELELDWETMESLRQMRNRICYYGKTIGSHEWKMQRLKLDICISSLRSAVSSKISGHKSC